jgi:hypothetical protein
MENDGSHQTSVEIGARVTTVRRIIFPEDTVNVVARKVSLIIMRPH